MEELQVNEGTTEFFNESLEDSSETEELYIQKLETIIENQDKQYTMMAQNNVNQLFVVGTMSALLVLYLLYLAIKKFI